MPRYYISVRNIIALALLIALAVLFASLGNWQLNRAAERDAIARAIERGRTQPELVLSHDTRSAELTPWRPAKAEGRFLEAYTVLIENRPYQGRPGYWVATPLQLASSPEQAVLVLRGWLPRPTHPGQPRPEIPAPPEHAVTIHGELLERVPRLFELWSWSGGSQVALPAKLPDPADPMPTLQNLELDAYAAASGLKLAPIVLAQLQPVQPGGPAATDTLLREWPEPSLESDKNRGYALQWFGFSTIALLAALALAWHTFIRRARPRSK